MQLLKRDIFSLQNVPDIGFLLDELLDHLATKKGQVDVTEYARTRLIHT